MRVRAWQGEAVPGDRTRFLSKSRRRRGASPFLVLFVKGSTPPPYTLAFDFRQQSDLVFLGGSAVAAPGLRQKSLRPPGTASPLATPSPSCAADPVALTHPTVDTSIIHPLIIRLSARETDRTAPWLPPPYARQEIRGEVDHQRGHGQGDAPTPPRTDDAHDAVEVRARTRHALCSARVLPALQPTRAQHPLPPLIPSLQTTPRAPRPAARCSPRHPATTVRWPPRRRRPPPARRRTSAPQRAL